MKKMILSVLLTSTLAYAADNDRLQDTRATVSLRASNPIYVDNIFSTNPKLETTLNYFSSNYPQSNFAKLNSEQRNALLVWAREIQLLEGLDEGSSLQKAQITPTPTDLGVANVLSYFKTTYPNSEIGKLNEMEREGVQLVAEFLHQKTGFTSAGSINMVMRVPENDIFNAVVRAEQGDDQYEFSKVWRNELKPYLANYAQNKGINIEQLLTNLF